jgi:hypothetical protein
MPRFSLSRRRFLRGATGGAVAAVALPALEAMLDRNGTAHSDGSPLARRFVAFHFGNGVIRNRFIPAATGPSYTLTPLLQPLANVKNYCHVLTGFENKHRQRITHHEGMAGMWSGYPFVSQGGGLNTRFGGPSIDQVAATEIGEATVFPSLQLGCSKRVSTDEGPTMQFMSHRSSTQPLPPEYSPRAVFQRLFAAPPPDDPSRPSRVDVLSAVMEDARALKAKIGASDRLRLDAHLESVSRIQTQINALPPACTVPAQPTQENVDVSGLEPMQEVNDLMLDLIVHAFTCDLTRVVSYMLVGGVGHTVYHFLDTLMEHHIMSHDSSGAAGTLERCIVWNITQFARLCEKLRAVPEGGGNLLDNSCLLLGSDCSEGWTHSIDEMCVVVAGGGGGALRRPGGHMRVTDDRNLSDVLLTCVRTVAPRVASIGSDAMFSTTPVTEIMA